MHGARSSHEALSMIMWGQHAIYLVVPNGGRDVHWIKKGNT